METEIRNKLSSLNSIIMVVSSNVSKILSIDLRFGDINNGKIYHQKQEDDNNCGMTAFLIGINILLGENIYTNNMSEW